MGLTAQKLALRCFGYTGIRKFAAQATGSELDSYTTADGDDMAAAINGGLQELYANAPRHFTHASLAVELPAPVAVTFTATLGSATISAASPGGSFVRGATLRSGGVDYEVINATTLLQTFKGATGAQTGTAYGDAVALAATVGAITEPVTITAAGGGEYLLYPADNFAGLRLAYPLTYIAEPGLPAYSQALIARSVGAPLLYFADTTFSATGTGATTKVLRVAPFPDAAYTVRFEAQLIPPVVAVADFANDTDPNFLFNLPNGWDELILLPFVLQRWTGSALFKNNAAKPEITRQYRMAQQALFQTNPHSARQLGILQGP